MASRAILSGWPLIAGQKTAVVVLVPVNTAIPSIFGAAQKGQTLMATSGSWTNSPTGYQYQWYRGSTAISGATSTSYIPVTADVGLQLRVGVKATYGAGLLTVEALSSLTATVADAVASDTTPDAFTIPAATNIAPGASVTRTFTYQGTDALSPFTVAGGDISFDNVTFASSGYAPAAPTGSPKTTYARGNAGPAGSTGSVVVTIGGVQATMSIQAQASSGGGATPLTIAPSKVIAWYDGTDRATMFSDAGVTQTASGGIVQRHLAKTPANPAGDTNFYREEAGSRRPSHGAAVYNGGKTDGIVYSANTMSLRTRNKSIGGTGTLSVLIAAQQSAAGIWFGIGNRVFDGSEDNSADEFQFKTYDGTQATVEPNGPFLDGYTFATPANIEVAHSGSTRTIYQNGVSKISGANAQTYPASVDISHNYCGAYQADGVTLSPGKLSSGAVLTEQHCILLSAPLSAQERIDMQAFLLASAGGLTQAIALKKFSTARTGSVAQGGTVWTMNDTSAIAANDYLVMEPLDAGNYGSFGPGGRTPEASDTNESAILARTYSNYNNYIRSLTDNKIYKGKEEPVAFVGSRSGTTLTVTQMKSVTKANGTVVTNPIVLGGYLNGDTTVTVEEQLLPLTGGEVAGGIGRYRTNSGATVASRDMSLMGGGGFYAWDASDFYKRYTQPRALMARVVSVDSSTQVTMSVAAVEAGTNLVVKQDNWKRLADLTGPDNTVIDLTANSGEFFTSRMWQPAGKKGWLINGPGKANMKLSRARGTGSGVFTWDLCVDCTIQNLTLRCVRAETWNWADNAIIGIGETLQHYNSTNTRDIDMGIEESSGQALAFRNCNTTPVPKSIRPAITIDKRVQQYLANWAINFINCGAPCEVLDFTFVSTKLQPALEAFQSNACYARGVMTDGLSALNTATNCIFDIKYTVRADSLDTTVFSPPALVDILNINGNVGASQGGGQASGGHKLLIDVDVQGWVDAAGNIPQGIVCAMPDCEIYGTYLPGTKNDGNRRGKFRSPVPKNAGYIHRATGIRVSGDNVNVHNILVETFMLTGSTATTDRPMIDFNDQQTSKDTGRIVDTITGGAAVSISTVATMSGNVTGNAYAALP